MNFSEQSPSKQWAVLKFRGEKFAEVWFKPEGKPDSLTFRILAKSFQMAGVSQQLTPENLLKIVAIAAEEVESWLVEDPPSAVSGQPAQLKDPLPPPAHGAAYLTIHVRLKPAEAALSPQAGEAKPAVAERHHLEARWKVILGIEASLDTLRMNMESLVSDMEASYKKPLTYEEKLHAKRDDVSQWTKARNRIHMALPRVREFIHRAVWAAGSPERKQLADVFKDDESPGPLPLPTSKLLEQLENLQKDRQVLSAHGMAVYQECKGLCSVVQEALRTLQSNAVANARKKKAGKSGKFF